MCQLYEITTSYRTSALSNFIEGYDFYSTDQTLSLVSHSQKSAVMAPSRYGKVAPIKK